MSRDISFGIALELTEVSAEAILNACDRKILLERAAGIASHGRVRADWPPFDVTDVAACVRAGGDIEAAGPLGLLVSNASHGLRKPVTDITDAQWQCLFDL